MSNLINFTEKVLSQYNATPDEWECFGLLKADYDYLLGAVENIMIEICSNDALPSHFAKQNLIDAINKARTG